VVETLRAMLRRQGKGEHAPGGAGHSLSGTKKPSEVSFKGFLSIASM